MPRISRLYFGIAGIVVALILLQNNHSHSSPVYSGPPNHPRSRPSSSVAGRNVAWSRDEYHEGELSVDSIGLTTWSTSDGAGSSSRHPIQLLIERGKKQAAALEERIAAIRTLRDAAEDYVKSFGMKPPKGFDAWYTFTQSSPAPKPPPVPSLLPFAHNPMLAFLSHPLDVLRARVAEVRGKPAIFTFTFVPDGQGDKGTACTKDQGWIPKDWENRGRGRVKVQGAAGWLWRCNNTLTLILPILPLLPDELFHMDPPLELAFSSDDGPRGMVHNSFREKSEALAKSGKVWPKAQLEKAEQAMRWTYGWAWSCPENSPLKTRATDLVLNDLMNGRASSISHGQKTFIADFDRAADYCSNPDLMGLHHSLLSEQHRAAVEMTPVVATCKTMWNSDIVGVPLDGVHEKVEYVPWEKKDISSAFWRGTATGLSHQKTTQWRSSQRERLHFFANNVSSATIPVLLPDQSIAEYAIRDLNEVYMDAGLSGGAVQCNKEDGSCADMEREIDFKSRIRKEDSLMYKFVLDVDGNGWSSRYRRLLSSNNVVLKSTLYPEWFQELLIPWYHYVPVKLDYSDLYDIMAFFTGSPDHSVPGHDDLARAIAENAQRFVEEKWRIQDMQSYTFLLILEYWRLMSPDRAAAVYNR